MIAHIEDLIPIGHQWHSGRVRWYYDDKGGISISRIYINENEDTYIPIEWDMLHWLDQDRLRGLVKDSIEES